MTLEFSRPIRLDTIGSLAQSVTIKANADERAALAARFDLVALDSLNATISYRSDAKGIKADGRLSAILSQRCVATGEPVAARIAEDFQILFTAPHVGEPLEEVELSPDDCDEIDHDGHVIELGEAVAQTLVLSLDPYPRHPDAAERLKAAGVLSEGEAGPFGVLAGLRDKLGKG
jgi:uncharacterized metal-binding protein YceD (DUF177 family)